MHCSTKRNIVIIENIINNTPIQHVSHEGLAKAIIDKTGRNCNKLIVTRLLKDMGVSLKHLEIVVRNKRLVEILIENKGDITTLEIESILADEGFKFNTSQVRELVIKARWENGYGLTRIQSKNPDKLIYMVEEAIDYIENHDFATITNPKIAYKIMKKYDVKLSSWQITKLRRLIPTNE